MIVTCDEEATIDRTEARIHISIAFVWFNNKHIFMFLSEQ